MTEEKNEEKKSSTLTLQPSKLKLAKSVDSSKIRHSMTSSGGKAVVVKRKRFPTEGRDSSIRAGENSADATTNAKLEILRKAAEKNAVEEEVKQTKVREENALEEQVKKEALEVGIQEEEVASAVSEPIAEPLISKTETNKSSTEVKFSVSKDRAVSVEVSADRRKKGRLDPRDSKGTRIDAGRRSTGKININSAFEEDTGRGRSLASLRRSREKARRLNDLKKSNPAEKVIREVTLPETITVQELSSRMSERGTDVVRELMKLGMMVTANQSIDADTAELVIQTFGHKVKRVSESDVEDILTIAEDVEVDLVPRPPVVTIMGHVDHGKTSLLDALRATDVVAEESGGITQHIGAYQVTIGSGKKITFLDTPGHEAFTAMRSRGAKSTDIVVLVVAADDGIMMQTKEAISHAKAAEVPIIVAINKIDKPEADPERVKNELLVEGLIPEDLGGDIIVVEVSAKERTNLDKLEESILLQAEMLELKANPDASASGIVIEAQKDRNKGIKTTLLIQRGTLKVGDLVVAGCSYGRVKLISDDKGRKLTNSGPATPVEILGIEEAPQAGDEFAVVESEKQARDICDYRIRRMRELKISTQRRSSLEELFSKAADEEGIRELPLIIKGDVQGSVEAIIGSIQKIPSEKIRTNIVHSGVGGISESDIRLAAASNALVLGFNVRASSKAKAISDAENVDIRYYSIIYNLLDEVKAVLSGMLKPLKKEKFIGMVDVRKVYNVSKVGKIAGCYVTEGVIRRGAGVRLLRDDVVIHEGSLKTLKRFKEDLKEVRESFECGIALENYNDIKEGDKIEVFEFIEEKQEL
jgi:translation initiation factor IF-2